jgi:hypothetical protein
MRVHNPKTGEVIVNESCKGGCYCHSLPIQFGDDKDVCSECGCPKTLAGFERVKAKQKEQNKSGDTPG